MATVRDDLGVPLWDDTWRSWPVSWSGVLVGTLTALAVMIVIGLIGLAVGAHVVGPSSLVVSWTTAGLMATVFSVCGALLSFVAGGWVAARVAGIRRAESAMLHGAISWLVAIPLVLFLAGMGKTNTLHTWYGGLNDTVPTLSQAPVAKITAAPDSGTIAREPTADEERKAALEAARTVRNTAFTALAALLLGLIGAVFGGWLASGEPMVLKYYSSRERIESARQPATMKL